MKFLKINALTTTLFIIGFGILSLSCSTFLVSCNLESDIDKNRDYIMQHTISIMVSGIGQDNEPSGSQALATA
jgi:hypothetical protein